MKDQSIPSAAGRSQEVAELCCQIEAMATEVGVFRAEARVQYKKGNTEACKRWLREVDRINREVAELGVAAAIEAGLSRSAKTRQIVLP